MKVLLMDLDREKRRRLFPNLALMKLSAYHKSKNDDVFLNFHLCQADLTYASCVFSWHRPLEGSLAPDIITGGSGTGCYENLLPPAIEHIKPDYSLYFGVDFSLGFTSRGCIRHCPFCIVPDKEGGIQAWAEIDEFCESRFRKIILLDNNLLAAPNWKETLSRLAELDVEADFNQGLDIRLISDENLYYLKQVRVKQYRFAFDDMSYEKQVRAGIALMLKAGINSRKLSFYVLIGYGEIDSDIERMKILNSHGVDVYPMLYKDKTGKEPERKIDWPETIKWHGSRQNLRKFLRLVGRIK